MTMIDSRTNYARDISAMLREAYGSQTKIFENNILMPAMVAEIVAEGVSIYGAELQITKAQGLQEEL